MIFVCSDLHGFPLKDFKKLLSKAGFSADDTLYILGDVIDRNGDGGIEMLRWIMKNKNIIMLKGNHEDMLLKCRGVFDKNCTLDIDEVFALNDYLSNGGNVTIKSMEQLKNSERLKIFKYLDSLPLYADIRCGNKQFVLVHGGFDNFKPHKKLGSYEDYEILWARPELEEKYFKRKTVIFGHTPTVCYGEQFRGKIIHTPTWINIDIGAAYGYGAALLKVDDMKEFYSSDILYCRNNIMQA